MRKVVISAALLSVSLIAFQLVLMQILSIVQWYHFAYMVISVALLAFGASGTAIALAREWFLARADFLTPLFMILSGAAMAVAVRVSQSDAVRFDSYLLFVELGQVRALLFTYLTLLVPFFFGALALGLIFVRHAQRIGRIYAANLVGSGLGGLAVLGLLALLLPTQLPPLLALLPISAGLLILPSNRKTAVVITALLAIAASLYSFGAPSALTLSEYKALARTMNLPDAKLEIERSSPHGLVQVVSSPALRFAPGLSVLYAEPVSPSKAVFNNADWFGPIVSHKRNAQTLRFSTHALPYVLQPRANVLVLQSKTGMFIAQALDHRSRNVTAVESHGAALSMLRRALAQETDSLFSHPAVQLHTMDPRAFLSTDTAHYDAILLPTLDAFGGTSGLFALQEQYLLTKEAFGEMWQRLTPNGVICITSWMDYPVRNPLRALATFVQTLQEVGIEQPANHIAAIRSWGTVTLAVKRTPLTTAECDSVRAFCDRLLFDPLLLPQVDSAARNRYNILNDTSFFQMVDAVLSDQREELYAAYDFNIRPADDNRPYFSQFLRWESALHARELFGRYAFPFLEIGSLIIALTLVQISALAFLLILLPLVRKDLRVSGLARTLLYFGALGLGYMFVEMVLIQRFILYLGHPLYAAAAVIGAMLIFSGAGSMFSSRIRDEAVAMRTTAGLAATIIALYTIVLAAVLQFSIGSHELVKVFLTCALIAPLAFVMGIPFPLGVRNIAQRSGSVAWAWGINGCMAVIAAPLATLIAVEWGFVAVLLCAAGAYAIAAVSSWDVA